MPKTKEARTHTHTPQKTTEKQKTSKNTMREKREKQSEGKMKQDMTTSTK